ncbi:MAG: sensor histidine kinase [Pseudopedobacter saltans]|uniref:Sensor histidine kinase n=1 Tax=Pseudopedobacter saltans TaxID=151895 RepID=A0A2W5ETI3_9SPHI|nr:MAG: sensor histidine kinase [Pseudopedobacter saltans]
MGKGRYLLIKVDNTNSNTIYVIDDKKLFTIVQVCGWLLYFIIVCLLDFSQTRRIAPGFYYYNIFLEAFVGLLITNRLRRRIIRKNLLKKPFPVQVGMLLLNTFVYSFLCSLLQSTIFIITGYYKKNAIAPSWMAQWITVFFLILIWNLLYFSYHYVQKSNKEALDRAQLESTVKDLELNTIKAHINPHFIFNALNSIRALVEEDPQRARHAITELSNLLRSSMQAEKRKTTTLKEELKIVNDYLALESIRFEDRLRVESFIDEDLFSQDIPPMSLQTLVENAIKHGISKEINGGKIEIVASQQSGICYIQVKNTGKIKGIANTDGFGIKSTVERLSLLFGVNASFSLTQNAENQVTATMKIPLSIKTQS